MIEEQKLSIAGKDDVIEELEDKVELITRQSDELTSDKAELQMKLTSAELELTVNYTLRNEWD